MPGARRLELSHPEFAIRAESFFRLMNLPEFQQEFFADPGGVVARELRISGVSSDRVDARNMMVFRLLHDEGFNVWAADFQHRIESEFPPLDSAETLDDILSFVRVKENRERLMAEFSESAIRHLAPDSFEEIIAAGPEDGPLLRAEPDIAVVPLTFIAIIVVVFVVAARGRTVDQISRLNIQATINKLTEDQLGAIERALGGDR